MKRMIENGAALSVFGSTIETTFSSGVPTTTFGGNIGVDGKILIDSDELSNVEQWTFTLEDGTEVTKKILVG